MPQSGQGHVLSVCVCVFMCATGHACANMKRAEQHSIGTVVVLCFQAARQSEVQSEVLSVVLMRAR